MTHFARTDANLTAVELTAQMFVMFVQKSVPSASLTVTHLTTTAEVMTMMIMMTKQLAKTAAITTKRAS